MFGVVQSRTVRYNSSVERHSTVYNPVKRHSQFIIVLPRSSIKTIGGMQMTVEEMKKSTSEFVTARDVRDILHVDDSSIRNQARADASKLGFAVVVCGNKVLIPRVPFLRFIGCEV